jgi:hypothetical protein
MMPAELRLNTSRLLVAGVSIGMHQLIKLALCCAISLTALPALAQSGRHILIEDFCWDRNFDGGRSFDCTIDGRLIGTLYDYPHPEFDQNDPDAWPTEVMNYSSSERFLPEDLARCVNKVRTDSKYPGVPEEDIKVMCMAQVNWIGPLGIAVGSSSFNFGHPIERGHEKADGDMGYIGILADVTAISCGCFVFDDTFVEEPFAP